MDAPEEERKIHSGGSGGIDDSNTQRESKHVEVPIECSAYKDGRTREDQRSLSPVNHRMQMLEHYQKELFNRQNQWRIQGGHRGPCPPPKRWTKIFHT